MHKGEFAIWVALIPTRSRKDQCVPKGGRTLNVELRKAKDNRTRRGEQQSGKRPAQGGETRDRGQACTQSKKGVGEAEKMNSATCPRKKVNNKEPGSRM